MANSRSAEKRVRVSAKKRARNVSIRSALKTSIKRFDRALTESPQAGEGQLVKTIKSLDMAAAKGIIHKNAAARQKSRLTKRLAKAQAQA